MPWKGSDSANNIRAPEPRSAEAHSPLTNQNYWNVLWDDKTDPPSDLIIRPVWSLHGHSPDRDKDEERKAMGIGNRSRSPDAIEATTSISSGHHPHANIAAHLVTSDSCSGKNPDKSRDPKPSGRARPLLRRHRCCLASPLTSTRRGRLAQQTRRNH